MILDTNPRNQKDFLTRILAYKREGLRDEQAVEMVVMDEDLKAVLLKLLARFELGETA